MDGIVMSIQTKKMPDFTPLISCPSKAARASTRVHRQLPKLTNIEKKNLTNVIRNNQKVCDQWKNSTNIGLKCVWESKDDKGYLQKDAILFADCLLVEISPAVLLLDDKMEDTFVL